MKRIFKDTRLFHHQVRVGRARKGIVITKLRTMKKGAHTEFRVGISKEEKRTTRIGRALRKLHLDDMPQLLSILRGEIVPVGLRARLRQDYKRLPEEVKKIYDKVGPGAWPIEYACSEFPPSRTELARTAREFFAMWKKSPAGHISLSS